MQETPAPSTPGPISFSIDLSGLANLITQALGQWIQDFAFALPDIMLTNSATYMRRAVASVLTVDSPLNVLIHNPLQWIVGPTTQAIHEQMLGARVGLVLLILVLTGYRVLKGHANEWEVGIQVGILLLLATSMHLWFPEVLRRINAAADSVIRLELPGSFTDQTMVMNAGFEILIMLLYGFWVALKAALKGMIGTIFLAILYSVGPFALLVGCIPFLAGISQWWIGNVIAWSIRPFMVALVLSFGLGIASSVADLHVQLLAAIAAFWLADKLPEWMSSSTLQASVWGSIGQMQLIGRAAGALSGAVSMPLAAGARALRAFA